MAAVVASLTAASTTIELIGRGREEAVATRADAIGPSITVVRAGVTRGSLARHEVAGRFLPSDIEARVAQALGSDLRRTERRLTIQRDVGGKRVLVIGSDDPALAARIPEGSAFLGADLARSIGPTSSLTVGDRPLPIAGIRQSTGGVEDVALSVSLATARTMEGLPGALTELRLHLRAGGPAVEAEQRLLASRIAASIIRHDRGNVVDGEIPGALGRHRAIGYALMALVASFALLIVSHLDAKEREGELATLLAIGASRGSLVALLTSRSVAVALAGAIIGAGGGFVLAVAQDPAITAGLVRYWTVPAAAVLAAAVLAALAALPVAIRTSLRDPAQPIQET